MDISNKSIGILIEQQYQERVQLERQIDRLRLEPVKIKELGERAWLRQLEKRPRERASQGRDSGAAVRRERARQRARAHRGPPRAAPHGAMRGLGRSGRHSWPIGSSRRGRADGAHRPGCGSVVGGAHPFRGR